MRLKLTFLTAIMMVLSLGAKAAVYTATGLTVTPNPNAYTYTGADITPSFRVYANYFVGGYGGGDRTLELAPTQYTAVYAKIAASGTSFQKDKGQFAIQATSKAATGINLGYGNSLNIPANLTGTANVTINAKPINASDVTVTWGDLTFAYNGEGLAPEPVVNFNSGTLTAGQNYNVTYKLAGTAGAGTATKPVDAGEYTIRLSGAGNYDNYVENNFTIVKPTLTFASADVTKVYDGASVELSVTPTVDPSVPAITVASDDWTLEYLEGETSAEATAIEGLPTNVGTYWVKCSVANTDKFDGTDTYFEIEITPATPTVTFDPAGTPAEFTYNGEAQAPVATVTFTDFESKELTLTEGTDYTVKYYNNAGEEIEMPTDYAKNAYKVEVTGQGNFTGTFDEEFLINKKTVYAQVQSPLTYDGTAQQVEVLFFDEKTFETPSTPAPAAEDFKVWYDPNGAINVGTFNVKVEILNANFKLGSTKEQEVTIEPRDLAIDFTDAETKFTFNGEKQAPEFKYDELADLENDINIVFKNTKGEEVEPLYSGNYTMEVTSANPNFTTSVAPFSFKIVKAALGVTFDETPLVYTGQPQTPAYELDYGELAALANAEDIKVIYTDAEGTEISEPTAAGDYAVELKLKGNTAKGFTWKPTGSNKFEYTIGPAEFTVTFADAEPFELIETETYDNQYPEFTVTFGEEELVEGTDYSVEVFEKGSAVATTEYGTYGFYTLVITPMGNFNAPEVEKDYEIVDQFLDDFQAAQADAIDAANAMLKKSDTDTVKDLVADAVADLEGMDFEDEANSYAHNLEAATDEIADILNTLEDAVKTTRAQENYVTEVIDETEEILAGALKVTIPASGVTTYNAPCAFKVADGVTAYYATSYTDEYVSLDAAPATVPANTGVVLKGEPGTYTFTKAETAEAADDNLLVATDGTTTVKAGSYYLATNGCFKKLTVDKVFPAGKAVLNATSAAVKLFLNFSDETGIFQVAEEEGTEAYTIAGTLAGRNYKGIVIKDGKKVLNK